MSSIDKFHYSDNGIIKQSGLYFDLMLLNGVTGTSYDRCIEKRRKEIEKIYKHLLDSDLLVITLGYIESWTMKENDKVYYLNRFPGVSELKQKPDKYSFVRLGVEDFISLIEESLLELKRVNKKIKILLTVSPVPISATFMPNYDCIVANSISKNVLLTTAIYLSEKYNFIDYFPSYEVALSMGINAFKSDLIHIRNEVVNLIVNYFLENYIEKDENLIKILREINRHHKVAIFGLGKSDKMTYEFIKKYYPEKIKYFIDDNLKGEYEGIPIVTTDEFLDKYQNEADIVVFGRYQHLNPKLLPNLKIKFVRLENII